MPRGILDLGNPTDLEQVNGVWKFAPGLVPGEPNEGLVAQLEGSGARLPDYDDSDWDECHDLTKWYSRGVAFAWYRLRLTLPETVNGRSLSGSRCIFETCVDDYGEIWIDGDCNRDRGTVQGFNVPQRVVIDAEPSPGDEHTIAILGVNGPLGAPGGAVFVRYATLAFEWREPGY